MTTHFTGGATTPGGPLTLPMTYDAEGNRLSRLVSTPAAPAGLAQTSSYNAADRLSTETNARVSPTMTSANSSNPNGN